MTLLAPRRCRSSKSPAEEKAAEAPPPQGRDFQYTYSNASSPRSTERTVKRKSNTRSLPRRPKTTTAIASVSTKKTRAFSMNLTEDFGLEPIVQNLSERSTTPTLIGRGLPSQWGLTDVKICRGFCRGLFATSALGWRGAIWRWRRRGSVLIASFNLCSLIGVQVCAKSCGALLQPLAALVERTRRTWNSFWLSAGDHRQHFRNCLRPAIPAR